jgi:hypothetical protein
VRSHKKYTTNKTRFIKNIERGCLRRRLHILSRKEAVKDLVSELAGRGLPGLQQLEVVVAGQNVEELGELPGHVRHPVLVA